MGESKSVNSSCPYVHLQDEEETSGSTNDIGNHVASASDDGRVGGHGLGVDTTGRADRLVAVLTLARDKLAVLAVAWGRRRAVRSLARRRGRRAVRSLARRRRRAVRAFARRRAVLSFAWGRRLGAVLSVAWGRSRLAVIALGVADELLVAVIAPALLVLALVALADKLLVALVAVALLPRALAIIADNLLVVAVVALTLGPVAVIALADDELAPFLSGAPFRVAVRSVTDDALLLALAGDLGGAVTAVADNLLLVPLNDLGWARADLSDLGHDVVGGLANGAVGDSRGA